MVSKSKTCTCTTWRYLKLVNNLLPQFECANALVPATEYYRSKKLAKVEFTAANRWHLKIIVTHVLFLEADNSVSEFDTLLLLVLGIGKF